MDKKILVVDDSEGTAKTIQQIFTLIGLETDYVLDAKSALNKLSSNKYDYAVLDIIINGDNENGIFIGKKIIENGWKTVPIFITGCEKNSRYAVAAAEIGHIVFKEFSPTQLAHDIIMGTHG